MTRRLTFSLLLFLAVAPVTGVRAEGSLPSVASLSVGLWPDYDRHSVLVLLTGVLTVDTPLPATVDLPFPDDAQLNAVARIDAEGRMIDDIEYGRSPGKLRLTTPDRRFRVEYYYPYRVDDSQYDFTFDWLADFDVQQLELAVQQPAHAESLVTVPAAVRVVTLEGGLRNHVLPGQAVSAGQKLGVAVSYTMTVPRLTVEILAGQPSAPAVAPPSAAPSAPMVDLPAEPAGSNALGWGSFIGILAAVLVCVFVFWQLERTRAAREVQQPDPPAGEGGARGRFCHQCGRPVGGDDRFCTGCGTELPGR
jgi:hypothetical protein